MRCLSTGVDKSEDSDLKGDLPKKNILSGLKDFAEITSGLENKSELKGKFDQFFITILNKLSNVQLGSNYIRKILIEIEKVIELGVIKDEDSLNQTLKTLSQEEKIPSPKTTGETENNPEACLDDPTVDNQPQKSPSP